MVFRIPNFSIFFCHCLVGMTKKVNKQTRIFQIGWEFGIRDREFVNPWCEQVNNLLSFIADRMNDMGHTQKEKQ